MSAGLVPSEAVREDLLDAFHELLAVRWPSSAFLGLISAFMFTWCSSYVRVCVQISSFSKGISRIRLGSTLSLRHN